MGAGKSTGQQQETNAGPITHVVIRCPCDEKAPGERIPQLVIEPGQPAEKLVPLQEAGTRDSRPNRTHGVLAKDQGLTLRAYTLLIWASHNANDKLTELPLAEAQHLRGWAGVRNEEHLKSTLYTLLRDSRVLEHKNGRVRIQDGVFLEVEGDADERAAIIAWAHALPEPPDATKKQQPREPDQRFTDYLATMEADIAARFQRWPAAAAAVARELRVVAPDDLAAHVTHALLHGKTGKEAVMALNAADEGMKHDATRADDRRALKSILLQVLPIATDWLPWVQEARSAVMAGANVVDLPLGTLTMAEAILAGIDCRSCRYVGDSPTGPVGGALVRKPAAEQVLVDPNGRFLLEATVGLLAGELLKRAPDAPELRNFARTRREVNEALQYHAEAIGEERLPRWLLLDDGLLAHVGDRVAIDDEARAAVAVTVLSEALPHLRILRMGEGIDGETNLALHIGGMWRKPI